MYEELRPRIEEMERVGRELERQTVRAKEYWRGYADSLRLVLTLLWEDQYAGTGDPLHTYCEVTGALCGGDQWLREKYCRCPMCLVWHKDQTPGG